MILAFFGVREVFVRRDALKKQEKNEEGKN
jgi:hypothetical protein